ncbi:asparagine synthase (glutamine-hydrolyzing) [Candidatus Thiosymbion oneisti]|uniref:asparagine synthase (glutamine-hydrolyzing) n=1 Tax=Candidatus Thiosymbion oneisti TaxID=589554 RepID=UPI000A550CD4|nr:asparagine synthase (glutamine-hydrolyzing) [Candidatus Thiosymbion oneisti]
MCGIVGIVGVANEQELTWLRTACGRMRHRGPDASGVWIAPDGGAAFGHRRLSIIDTSSDSHQPFVSEDGLLILVFNGEIYNYLELRAELEALGERFRTEGDTEVLLAAYRHWGTACLGRLNGMWAFSIWDRRRGPGQERLFVARDRAGEKPFYYRHRRGRLEFASELKGLRVEGGIDLQALNHYLALGYVPGDLCIAAGVRKLPPGHAGLFDRAHGGFKVWRYWQLPERLTGAADATDGEMLAEQAWSLLVDSTRLRLRSDVPTGVFLSGGLDSSLVTAAAAHVSGQPIQTFTIGNPGSALDETAHAQLVADAFGTKHQVLPIEQPSLGLLDEFAPFVDEPIADSSILPMFLISRLTRRHVTVALGGDGGDELYGGYSYYQAALRDRARLGWLPKPALGIAARLAVRLPAGVRGRNRLASLRASLEQASIWGTPYFDIELRCRILTPDVLAALGPDLDAPERRSLALFGKPQDPVDGLTRLDFQQVLADDFLVKVDRASMANSLEVRTPFLDYRLVEHAFREIPPHWKCTPDERRRVQNLMAKKYLPKGFVLNRKQGFSVPMDQWMKAANAEEQLETLPRDLINLAEVMRLHRGQLKNRTNGARLFALFMLEKALKNCGDNFTRRMDSA